MSLFKKMIIPFFSAMLILCVIVTWISLAFLKQAGQSEVTNLKISLTAEKTVKLKNLVELAYKTIETVANEEGLSDQQRKEKAKNLIKAMRYNSNDYLWINDMTPVMVMHPFKPELDGRNVSTFKDPNGKTLFLDFIEVCKAKGEGIVDYMWPKPGKEEPVPKLSYVKLFAPWGWIIGTGIYIEDVEASLQVKREEIKSRISKQSVILFAVSLTLLAISTMISAVLFRKVIQHIRYISEALKDIAQGKGDLTKRLTVTTKDEIGELATWFNKFAQNMNDLIGSVTNQARQLKKSSGDLDDISGYLAGAAENSSLKSKTVAGASEALSNSVISASTAIKQTSENVNMISAAVEQLSITIKDIAQKSDKGNHISSKAVSKAKSASLKVEELGRAAKEIGKVTETITEISEQTNLLALNATIEAARAGEAGKGFAVVANEIKELAKQTAGATQTIEEKIDSIQGSTEETVVEISEITEVITEVNAIVTTIAKAVEEQSMATHDIVGNVSDSSQSLQNVTQNMGESANTSKEITQSILDVNHTVSEIASSGDQIKANVNEMNQLSLALGDWVEKFKICIGADCNDDELDT